MQKLLLIVYISIIGPKRKQLPLIDRLKKLTESLIVKSNPLLILLKDRNNTAYDPLRFPGSLDTHLLDIMRTPADHHDQLKGMTHYPRIKRR